MTSLTRQQGWLMIDHTASPGSPAVPEGKRLELDTYTCGHCQAIVIKHMDRLRPRLVCRKCMAVVCDTPTCHPDIACTPYGAQFEAAVYQAYHPSSDSPLILPNRALSASER